MTDRLALSRAWPRFWARSYIFKQSAKGKFGMVGSERGIMGQEHSPGEGAYVDVQHAAETYCSLVQHESQ